MIDTIVDQDKPVFRLLSMMNAGAVPHALLFTGMSGTGKHSVARAFAMALNCRSSDRQTVMDSLPLECSCRSCHKIRSNTHPDIITVKPNNDLIKIAQIRELTATLLIKPVEAIKRVVIIDDAHTMNPEAGNALLKSLEEPPPDTLFILISHLASDLLPTLLSRCQQIGFNPISQTRISNELSKLFGADSAHIQAITSMAGGSLGQAFAIMEKTRGKTSFFSFRAFLFNELTTLKNRPPIDLFMFSEKLSSKKDQAIEAIDMLFSFVRDMIICKYSPEKIINRDISEKIIGASRDYSLPSLIKLTEHIVTARKSILSNGSLRLALDVMAINIKRV